MLISNVGTWNSKNFALDDPWWINTPTDSHAAVFLNTFWDASPQTFWDTSPQHLLDTSYNGTGDDNKVKVARALKARNPQVKTYFYQPGARSPDGRHGLYTKCPQFSSRVVAKR
jgi:hypothetical protein